MSESLKIALTAVTGIAVYVFGQIIMKWFIEPIQEQRKLRGKIVHALASYTNMDPENYPIEKVKEASEAFRSLASEIQGTTTLIPCYRLLTFLHVVQKEDTVLRIAAQLFQLSNNLSFPKSILYQDEILRLLKVRHLIKTSV